MVLVWLFFGALIVQFALAKFTADDAHSRGHNETSWFVGVLIFGIPAILVYLLTRNDQRLPESERPPNKLNARLSSAAIYGSAALVGLVIFGWIGREVGSALFSVFERYDCAEVQIRDYTAPDACVVSEARYETLERNNLNTLLVFALFGLLAPPSLIYLVRKKSVFE